MMRLTHCSKVRLRTGDNDRTATGPGVPVNVSAGSAGFMMGLTELTCFAEEAIFVGAAAGRSAMLPLQMSAGVQEREWPPEAQFASVSV